MIIDPFFWQIRNTKKQLTNCFPSNQNTMINENRVAKMVMVMVVLFVVCNSAESLTNVLMVYKIVGANLSTRATLHFLIVFNSSVNTIVYGLFNKKFRRLFFNLICPCYKQIDQETTVVSTSKSNPKLPKFWDFFI